MTIAAASASAQARLELDGGEAELGQLGDVGVVVGDLGAELAQEPDDLQRRRFAGVADPGLVADAEDQDPRAATGLPASFERPLDQLGAEGRLGLVDLAGQLDELRVEVVLAGLEGEVEGVDRQAVAAHPRAGVEAHEAEGLGRGGVDHLPDVDRRAGRRAGPAR